MESDKLKLRGNCMPLKHPWQQVIQLTVPKRLGQKQLKCWIYQVLDSSLTEIPCQQFNLCQWQDDEWKVTENKKFLEPWDSI